MFGPLSLLAALVVLTDSSMIDLSAYCDFYIQAEHMLLPSYALDMLTVQIGQLTVKGLAPF